MIVESITENKFVEVMAQHGFSNDGASVIFEELTDIAECTGENIKFDPIAIRCDFDEYENLEEFLKNNPDCEVSNADEIDGFVGYLDYGYSDGFILRAW